MPHVTLTRSPRLIPRLAAAAAALVGLINIASALTPDIRWRGHLLLVVEPLAAMRTFHALALPAGAALLLVAPYLWGGRRRAWQTAIVLMLVLGVLDLLKGLDVEETAITWFVGWLLMRSGRSFPVHHEPITLRSAVWRVPLLGLIGVALSALAAWASEGHPSWRTVVHETSDLLAWRPGPLRFERHTALHHSFAWIPVGVHLVEIGTLLGIAYLVFRPLAAPRALPGPAARAAADRLVRAHGTDTLSFFKLRGDEQYLFSEDRRSFVGYRVEAGVMLLSGDPVAPREALPELLTQVREFAAARGLKLGAVGASEALAELYRGFGLKTIYLGDEAVVDARAFSLQGRPIRKVRQSVTRLTRAGYVAELRELRTLEPSLLAQIEHVVELGREGAPERGFSMAMDSLQGAGNHATLVVIARDENHDVRGVLHFVPCYGRPAMSLSYMRRDPSTPNGLTEFLVARGTELLRERGVEEISLNFATFARWMHSPEKRWERALGKIVKLANPFFQIESLYRFNAKFFPRWEPRYLVYEGRLGLLRVALAAMWAEGQAPKPSLPALGRRRDRSPRLSTTA